VRMPETRNVRHGELFAVLLPRHCVRVSPPEAIN
jgi:hypothetical protein